MNLIFNAEWIAVDGNSFVPDIIDILNPQTKEPQDYACMKQQRRTKGLFLSSRCTYPLRYICQTLKKGGYSSILILFETYHIVIRSFYITCTSILHHNIHFLFNLKEHGNYIRQRGRKCSDAFRYDTSDLDEAKRLCSNDPGCTAIVTNDSKCNTKQYGLCKGKVEMSSESCIVAKGLKIFNMCYKNF